MLRDLVAVLATRDLPAGAPAAAPPPSVSAIVAARDESERIAATARAVLAQTGVELELLVVDDRSADGTGAALGAIADPRLLVLRVAELAPGWLGKAHALHLGAGRARGTWLLFLDADTRLLEPDVIARAVALAGGEGAAHVCLLPRHATGSGLGTACALMFQVRLAPLLAGVNRDRRRAYLGVGVFNLVLASTYRAFGGHQPLRLEVVDDMKLSQLVRRAGGRSRARLAPAAVATEWSATLPGFVRGLDKNLFAALGYQTLLAAGATVLFGGAWVLALAGPWLGGAAGFAAAGALLGHALPALVLAPRTRTPLPAALLVPFLLVLFPVAIVRSTALTLARGGVRWRDTFYPLPLLRAGRLR